MTNIFQMKLLSKCCLYRKKSHIKIFMYLSRKLQKWLKQLVIIIKLSFVLIIIFSLLSSNYSKLKFLKYKPKFKFRFIQGNFLK